jgi:hypothetical protein
MVFSTIEPEKMPLARLALFIICLATAGSILAGSYYLAIDLPQQKVVAPKNSVYPPVTDCETFLNEGCDSYCWSAAGNEQDFDWGACGNHCNCLTAACEEKDPHVMNQKKAAC